MMLITTALYEIWKNLAKNPYLDALCEEGSTPICVVDKTGDT